MMKTVRDLKIATARTYRERTRLYLVRPDKYQALEEYLIMLGQTVAWWPVFEPSAMPTLKEV